MFSDVADLNRCRHTPNTVTVAPASQLRPVAAMLILSNDLSDSVVGTNHGRNWDPGHLGCKSQKFNIQHWDQVSIFGVFCP